MQTRHAFKTKHTTAYIGPWVRDSVGPWLAGPQAWLAEPHAWLAGPEAWLDAPEGGCTDEQMDVQLDRQSPHSTGLCSLLEPLPPPKKI